MSDGRSRERAGADILRVCRRLYDRGLIAGPDGNVSVRLRDGTILVTPAGLSKVDVRDEDLVIVNLEGNPQTQGLAPSSELLMHLRIYQRRPDAMAVVHAHPPVATGFAVAGEDFVAPVLPEVILQMGGVPLLPYATPGTPALADSFEPFLDRHDAFLLANHGATTLGPTLDIANQRMESLEHAARIVFTARMLGKVNELSASYAEALRLSRED